MKTRNVILLLMVVVGISARQVMSNDSYEAMWKRVESAVRKDLPRTVVDEAKLIYDKAEKERNVPQMVKAYYTVMRFHGYVSNDYRTEDMVKMKQWAEEETSLACKAALYSILGMETLAVYDDNLKEGLQYMRRSLEHAEELMEIPAQEMKPLAISGETSTRYLEDNLYELLARRAVDVWKGNVWLLRQYGNLTMDFPDEMDTLEGLMNTPLKPASEYDVVADIMIIYQTLLKRYQQEGKREALVLTALEAYEAMKALSGGQEERFEKQLLSLMGQFADVEACAEVYISLLTTVDMDVPARLDMARKGIKSYPGYPRINRLKALEEELTEPVLNVAFSQPYPGDSTAFTVQHRNVDAVRVSVYRIDLPATSSKLDDINEKNVGKYGQEIVCKEYALTPGKEYEQKKIGLSLPPLPVGVYYVVAHDMSGKMSEKKDGNLLYVSSLYAMGRMIVGDRYQMAVVDRKTGHPVPQGEVVLFKGESKKKTIESSCQTDERGIASFYMNQSKWVEYQVRTPQDSAMYINSLWINRSLGYKSKSEPNVIRLFTDRAVYRPGQKVKVSGMAYTVEEDLLNVNKSLKVTLTLWDANWEKLEQLEVSSDAFGVFSGEFVLPRGRMNGQYTVEAQAGDDLEQDVGFQVEEYKRPTFEVTFEPVMDEFKAGDDLELIGVAKNYSGAPVQRARVKYTVVLRESRWWYSGDEIHREAGEAVTDAEGRFKVPVQLQDMDDDEPWYYDCIVEADVTGLSGETQSGSLALPMGSSSVIVSMKDWESAVIQKELKKPLCFSVTNLMGEKVDALVDYRVFRLNDEGGKPMLVLEGTHAGNASWSPDEIYALPSGKYRLVAGAKDRQGRHTEDMTEFELFAADDPKVPSRSGLWCHQSASVFKDDQPVTLWVGTSEKDVCLYYDVFTEDKHLVSETIWMTDTLQKFSFPYQPEYGNGIRVTVSFVKDNRMYKQEFNIEKPAPDKRLMLKWKTFRDKLRPGDKEQWTLTVSKPDGSPVSANLMATLYDASLDALVDHGWLFSHYFPRFIPRVTWDAANQYVPSMYFHFQGKPWNIPRMQYSRFWKPEDLERRAREEAMMIMEENSDMVFFEEEIIPLNETTVKSYASPRMQSDAPLRKGMSGQKDVQIRTNFEETAFFSPNLRTDRNGDVTFSFTLPESLTRWKFMGLAHTHQMDYGQLEAMAVASKDFMLQPQLPRFVRIGDQVTLSAMVMNLTDKTVKGKVRMELFDPETDKVWLTLKQKFAVAGKGSESVRFSFDVSDKYQVLAVRMLAEGNGFSDGEQRYLPVLSDKRWMTETLPLYINANETRTFPMDDLFNKHSRTATGHQLTVEMTGNPTWYAVQALPALSNPSAEDALSWSVAHYANTLASYIVQSNPRIRQVVESWQKQDEAGETFRSQLQKNEELKEVLLEETPWLMEAKDEEEQRRRLAVLFDVAQMKNRLAESASRLGNLQMANGEWAWFSGMSGSRFVTTQVVQMLARLQAMTGQWNDKSIRNMYVRGMKYLAKELAREVEEMKAAEKRGVKGLLPSEDALRYLYICSLDAKADPDKSVTDYLINRLEKMTWDLTTYGKAKCALILHRFGKEEAARMFMQSLMEYSVVNEEMGRYFDTRFAEYSWLSYKIPVQVAAIEAVHRLDGDEQKMNELKRWLLKQKQTQSWETPLATSDAIYALLCTGTDMLSEGNRVSVTLNDVVVRTPDDALGYVKQTLDKDVTKMTEAVVRNEGKGIAWGAVYAQFLEHLDKVSGHGNALKVNRTLYKDGEPLPEGEPLQVGDKITIRLTVTSDRDMDFVRVKDERASCMEPVDVVSGYRWGNRIGYYQETKDASTSFFFDCMRKGTYKLEYEVYITSPGQYTQGIATAQSVYAPEFAGHGSGGILVVK